MDVFDGRHEAQKEIAAEMPGILFIKAF